MASPISSTNTIGPVTFAVTIPADKNYGGTAVITASLQNTLIGAFQFSPTNNQWLINGAVVGTTTLSFTANYAPATAGTIGNITVGSMTVTVSGQNPQPFSGTLFVWNGSGLVLVPSA